MKPLVERGAEGVRIKFDIETGNDVPQEGTVNRRGAHCIACGTPVPFDHVRAEGKAERIGVQLMAIVAEGKGRRIYLPPSNEHTLIAASAKPDWMPETQLPEHALGFRVQLYGMNHHRDLFTPRQIITLTFFCDIISEVRKHVMQEAIAAGIYNSDLPLYRGGNDATAYADAVATYLSLAVSKTVNRCNALATWKISVECPGDLFTRQAVSMIWDFAESNVLSGPSGSFESMLENSVIGLETSDVQVQRSGKAIQVDAAIALTDVAFSIVSTDPPYYDNIGYADLSDVFYIWLRRSLRDIFPDLFSTLLVPKAEELVATPHRFGGNKNKARQFFEDRLAKAFTNMGQIANIDYPLTVYYAFKQSEENDDMDDPCVLLTGWETMLEGLLRSGFIVTGTWPIRTERRSRTRSLDSNALASSIVLVCRPRSENAPIGTRKEFIATLKRELPDSLRKLQKGNIAPVDLAQASIGPGMAIFSRYSKVLEADGTSMRVRTALQLINQHLDEYLSEQEGEYDSDTRWALSWFEQYGMNEGPFGDAETLSRAKNTSVQGMVEAGILKAGAGRARLLKREEMNPDWDPATDRRLTVWEATQYLILALESRGEGGAAELLHKLGGYAQSARDLAYRLYSICERKGWSQEALAYNSLVTVWPRLSELSQEKEAQRDLSSFRQIAANL